MEPNEFNRDLQGSTWFYRVSTGFKGGGASGLETGWLAAAAVKAVSTG